MVVSLYTSRIVLDALGIIDYGLYNVVGGIVIALGFLSGTLNTASSRFITVALSTRKLEVMQKTFSNILFVNVLLSFVIYRCFVSFQKQCFFSIKICGRPAENLQSHTHLRFLDKK